MKKGGYQTIAVLGVVAFSIIIIGVAALMTLKNTAELTSVIEAGIKSELISTSMAAREMLDAERLDQYDSLEDIRDDIDAYQGTLADLHELKRQINAGRIYVLKPLNGKFYIIFDTNAGADAVFYEYPISYVHERAFLGYYIAGVENVEGEHGRYNTGAVPIRKDSRVIGIVSTSISDRYIVGSRAASARNAAIMVVALVITMGVMSATVWRLLGNVRKMQDKLFKMANYDVLTGLPNRQYLVTYLEEIARKALTNDEPFAFLLIDLDNFKKVNDGAGHEAGDEMLRHFALYLSSILEHSKSFRPPAGALNISARIGGDEFVQIVPGVRTVDEADMVAKKVLDGFSSQTMGRHVDKYNVGLSIGVALFPLHTKNFNVLIKYADIAMYHAKRSGKSAYRVYDKDMILSEPADQQPKQKERRQFRR